VRNSFEWEIGGGKSISGLELILLRRPIDERTISRFRWEQGYNGGSYPSFFGALRRVRND